MTMNDESTPQVPLPAESTTSATAPSASAPVNPTASPGKALAVASLVIGIVALLGVAIPVLNVFSALLAVLALILGIVALTRATRKGLPLSGVIVSGLALLLSVIFIVVYIAGFTSAVGDIRNDTSVVEGEEDASAEDVPTEEPQPDSEVGTRANPASLGTTIEITELGEVVYELTMGPSTLDATAIVLETNMFNEAPPAGFQYALVPVALTYVGSETGTPWLDITVEFVSAAGTTHTEGDSLAVAPAPTLFDINELYPGASATGNVVILIPIDNAAAGTWAVSTFFGEPFFFTAE